MNIFEKSLQDWFYLFAKIAIAFLPIKILFGVLETVGIMWIAATFFK